MQLSSRQTIPNDAEPRLAVISPCKDELGNLPSLVDSIEAQKRRVSLWIIVDDRSKDGSSEWLKKRAPTIRNVENVLLVQTKDMSAEYRLGTKYASVIAFGINALFEYEVSSRQHYDFVGILDSDCTVAPDYYELLLGKFRCLPRLGIASGVIHFKGGNCTYYDRLPLRWARGAVRVWRRQCLDEAPYQVTKAADSVSAAKAWTRGWQCQAFKDCRAQSREMGVRTKPTYYGAAAYYFYVPKYYMLLKTAVLFCREGRQAARDYYIGYLEAEREGQQAPVDQKVIAYYRSILLRNLYERMVVALNCVALWREKRGTLGGGLA